MRWGVREWVTRQSSSPGALLGSSSALSGNDFTTAVQPNKRTYPGMSDVGFRLAADAVPLAFEQYSKSVGDSR